MVTEQAFTLEERVFCKYSAITVARVVRHSCAMRDGGSRSETGQVHVRHQGGLR